MSQSHDQQQFNRMTEDAFHWHLQDIDTLRSKVMRLERDLPRNYVMNGMSRIDLVNALLSGKYGNDNTMAYIQWSRETKEMEAFVNS